MSRSALPGFVTIPHLQWLSISVLTFGDFNTISGQSIFLLGPRVGGAAFHSNRRQTGREGDMRKATL